MYIARNLILVTILKIKAARKIYMKRPFVVLRKIRRCRGKRKFDSLGFKCPHDFKIEAPRSKLRGIFDRRE